ncbi:hypothetical protein L7F22_027734 [Adiantum nelumboides]|nr:hypothetical protein [Adiantum nelumboides]
MRCPNLGTIIPSPFVVDELIVPCAPGSEDFVLANCSSTTGQHVHPRWPSFTKALPTLMQPPAVIGLSSDAAHADPVRINITWDSSGSASPSYSPWSTLPPACQRLHSSRNFSPYFPEFIDLSQLHAADSQIYISSNTMLLLFNCSYNRTKGDSIYVKVKNNSSACQSYKHTCTSSLTAMFTTAVPSCHELVWPDDTELTYYGEGLEYLYLQSILDSMSCTHFEVFVVNRNGGSDETGTGVAQWLPGAVQLLLIDNNNCRACLSCFYLHSISICDLPFVGGIAIGCLLLFLGICCCVYRCGSRSMKNRRLKRRALWERQRSVAFNNGTICSELMIALVGPSERPVEYSFKSIAAATRSFSNLVGKGGFGMVFKGELAATSSSRNNGPNQEPYLSTSREIAVKVLDVRSHHTKKQFVNEVAIIGRVHHINVVRLLGFCVHDEHEMLVYEYVTNGSLAQWLFEPASEKGMNIVPALDWRQRYSIAVGIARGLSYLHEECRHGIVHCDVKPQNILLDAQMCPKIADFGLARLINRADSRVVTFAKGTPGYMAPELWVGGDIQLSTKADVYSFGMVLLELISGRKSFAHGLSHFPAVAFNMAINKGDFNSLLDERLTSPHVSSEQKQQEEPIFSLKEQIRIAVLVAFWCIQDNPAARPCMSLVVQFLEGVAAVSEHPPSPTIASASSEDIMLFD